ncbi:MAG: cyclase family protein [Gammaproteobacteria bacterium]|jgi:kynurenine formamidase
MSEVFLQTTAGPRRVDPAAIDISIPLDFAGRQPNHFGAPPAVSEPLKADGFVGDVRAGGSCNCEVLTLTPHCNGTHTECVGHLSRERVSVAGKALAPLLLAALVSVEPVDAARSEETADPSPRAGDQLITAAALRHALEDLGELPEPAPSALVVRTLPNEAAKTTMDYTSGPVPPYFSLEAIGFMVDLGIRHLLCDLPSIDRSHDEGRLGGHRLFWGLAGDAARDRSEATVTEMIYVPDAVADGFYGLSLQLPPFMTDAAPSRPLLYALDPP